MAGPGGSVLASRVRILRNGNGSRHRLSDVWRAADPPVGEPAAPVEVCHSACEMGRSPERGRIPTRTDAGRALAKNWRCANGTAETDASASASPVALLSCDVIGDPNDGRKNSGRPTGRSPITSHDTS
uniref:Uncharacterized protein n=1 Tax=Schizaphis graminum TaxID=13262 RepID=A0A2S2PNH6_SCHGA